MTLWVLDTDHVSLLLQGNQAILSRVIRHYPNVGITIVTVQEIFNGWIIRINNPTQTTNLVRLYTNLWTATEYFKGERIINFDDNANAYYQRLLNENQQLNKKRLQKDLRIAAITLSVNGIMVTRNQRDFSQVSDLVIEDWTQ
jgi:tRNA(fMet)-specific endonuclease VapC